MVKKTSDEALAEAVDVIVTETKFNPGYGVDARVAAEMLVSVTYRDWCAERTTTQRRDDGTFLVTSSEERAFRSLLGWGVDVGNAYRVLACFRVAQGEVVAERPIFGQFAHL